jgi:uncharacterized protein GlcG (DUF336 family)
MLTSECANRIISQAAMAASQRELKMNIAVVDEGGNLKTFRRMDGAWLGSIDIAIKKARTAVLFSMRTGDIGTLSQPGGSLYGIEHTNGGLVTFPGGELLIDSIGNIIGGIGVSGDAVENDMMIAKFGAASV